MNRDMNFLLVLLIASVPVIAQECLVDSEKCCFGEFDQCLQDGIFTLLDEQLFDAILKEESEGDICKIDGNKIGPFQISKEYYEEAVRCKPSLSHGGKPVKCRFSDV